MIDRLLEKQVQKHWGGRKIIIVLGPRQVGKTTLLKKICEENDSYLFLNGDDFNVRALFKNSKTQKESKKAVQKYLSKKIKQDNPSSQGIVYVGIIVKKDGTIDDIHIKRDVNDELDRLALKYI